MSASDAITLKWAWVPVFRSLLWAEWFAHSRLLLIFLVIWLLTVWLIPVFAHSGWILGLAVAYPLLAGPSYGGGDVLDGCEEFTFALPVTRGQRYWARATVGIGTLIILTAIDLLALGLDLGSVISRLYISTGLIESLSKGPPRVLYGLIGALPFAVFTFSFVLSAVTRSRLLVLSAWFWGGLGALAVLQGGLWIEEQVWGSATGLISCPVLGASGVGVLLAGWYGYRRKEIGPPVLPLTLPARWWLWLVVFLVGGTLAALLFASLARHWKQFIAG